MSLDEIVALMSDEDIADLWPYATLTYWAKDVDFLITIDQLHDFLTSFGFTYDPKDYPRDRVSQKIRGNFSESTRKRIARLFQEDVWLFQNVTARNSSNGQLVDCNLVKHCH